jgi:hypothetical protein
MQTYTLTLSKRELTYTLLALRKYREAILDKDEDELGDDLDDLMLLDNAIEKLKIARDAKTPES